MSHRLSFVLAPFILLLVLALYSTWYLLLNNQTGDLMSQIRDFGPHLLPNTKAALKTSYTGIPPVDYQLTVLTLFFWEIVDGLLPQASLQVFHFFGQFLAAICLLMIEGYRRGNRGKLISFVWLWGLAMQNFTFAVVIPVYSIVFLCTVTTPSNIELAFNLPDIGSIATIPISTTVGYIIPAVLFTTPTPATLSFNAKQNTIALWQVFPVTVEVLQRIISPHLAKVVHKTHNLSPSTPEHSIRAVSLATLRRVYMFVLVICAITHIRTLSIIGKSYLSSSAFAPDYTFLTVFVPSTSSAAEKMASIGEGARLLLQYDEIIGSITILLWATINSRSPSPSVSGKTAFSETVVILALGTALLGPVGCAVIFLWMRDERALTRSAKAGDKTT